MLDRKEISHFLFKGILLHAASVAINNNAALICGNSGDGKTTITSSLLLYSNMEYLSNDRTIVVHGDKSGYDCIPYPLPLNIGLGAYNALREDMNIDLMKCRHHNSYLNILEQVNKVNWRDSGVIEKNWGNKEKILLTTAEVQSAFNCSNAYQPTVTTIIIPMLCKDKRPLTIKRISYEEAVDKIQLVTERRVQKSY